jgi:hypothetical protein
MFPLFGPPPKKEEKKEKMESKNVNKGKKVKWIQK